MISWAIITLWALIGSFGLIARVRQAVAWTAGALVIPLQLFTLVSFALQDSGSTFLGIAITLGPVEYILLSAWAIIDLSIPVTIIQGRSRRKRRLVTLIKNLAALHLAFYLAQFLIISLLALTGMPAQVALVFAASVFSLWLVIGTISLFVSYGRGILIGLVSLPIISLIAFLVAYYGTLNLGNPTLVLPTPLLVLVGVIVLLLPIAADLWILKPPPEWFDFSGDEVDAMPRAPGHSGLILAEALRNCLASQQPYRIRQQILRFIRVAVLFHH